MMYKINENKLLKLGFWKPGFMIDVNVIYTSKQKQKNPTKF